MNENFAVFEPTASAAALPNATDIFQVASPPEPFTWGKHLFSFDGRTRRFDFWVKGVLVRLLAWLVLIAVLAGLRAAGLPPVVWGVVAGTLSLPFFALFIWVSLAIEVKRWHDRDKSGWFVFIALIPLVGAIWALVELGFLRGSVGNNRFGADPVPRS